MQLAKKVRPQYFRLGEILLEAGIISPDVLTQGLVIAKRATMPIGRVLIMSGHVSELDVECALNTQLSIRDGAIDVRMAKEMLRFSHVHQVNIDEAYRLNGIGRGIGPLPRMGKLVMAAGIVDDVGLKCALKHAQTTGYPLGRALVALRLIDESTLSTCVNLQILIRDRHISFLQAVRALQSIYSFKVPMEAALKAIGFAYHPHTAQPRLGEILVRAGLLAKEDSLIVAELGTESDAAFGQLLLKYNLVKPMVLEAAVQMQQMLGTPMLSKVRARRLLNLVNSMNVPLEKLFAEFDLLDQVVAILRAAGMIDERTMRDTAASINDFEYTVAEVLIQRGLITKEMSRTALVLINEIQRNVVSYEKALDILRALRPNNVESAAMQQALAVGLVAA
ncbi:MAG: hypothetical protein K2X93_00860 [Candidatus Obscuribacterales bacterium]|nr:hypothetical protein [Candidatus Obscuribacterales bacterium]